MRHVRTIQMTPAESESLARRLLANVVHQPAPPSVTDACWIYAAKWQDGRGYKKVRWKGRAHYVHRLMYTASVGEIPETLLLDHKCRVRGCCNPAHLEPVTVKENTMRGNGKWIFEQGYNRN